MVEPSKTLLVMSNVPDMETARAIATLLVERKLAACVNCLPAVQSVYRWEGAIEHAEEVCLLIKTTELRYPELQTALADAHPYEVPEVLAFPVLAGLPAYLSWIGQETERAEKGR